MRISSTLLLALVLVCTSETNWAQNPGTSSLVDQIRELESAVEGPPAKVDGKTWLRLAILRQDAAEYQESERAYRRAIELLKGANPPILADALDQMGTMYVERGEFSKAEHPEREALAIREELKDSVGIGVSHMHLAMLSLGRRKLASAQIDAETAVHLLVPESRSGSAAQTAATPEEQMTALIDLSLVRCARGACSAAVPDLQRALQLAHANYTANSIPVGFLDFLLGYASWKGVGKQAGGELMKKGLHEMEAEIGWGHPTYISALMRYRSFLIQSGQTTEAAAIDEKLSRLEKLSEARHAQSENASIHANQP